MRKFVIYKMAEKLKQIKQSKMEFIFVALAILIALASHFLTFLFKQEPKNLPPGNMGWPLIGETISFLKAHKSNSPGTFLQEHCSRYGKVFKSHLFGSKAIVSCDLELNLYILHNYDLFPSSYPKAIHDILGKYSLLVVSGDLHKKIRFMVVSFIGTYKATPSFMHSVENLTLSLFESWKTCKEVFFYKESKKLALSLAMKLLLSLGPDDMIAAQMFKDFETFMAGFISLPVYIPGTAYAKAIQARARLSSTIIEITEKRKENAGHPSGDFLDVLMSKQDLKNDERVSVVMDILLGAYDTTASLISLIVYFLVHSPEAILNTLREEHMEIRKSKENGDSLNLTDYKNMKFTSYVINEALRCGNVVKFLHRKAAQDVKFKEYFIPAGWKVLPIFTAAHMDPVNHENPGEFNPWRWADKAILNKNVTPFGGGTRLCAGADLARMEVSVFLHHFVLNYRWKTKADEFPMAYPYIKFQKDLLLEIEPIENKPIENLSC